MTANNDAARVAAGAGDLPGAAADQFLAAHGGDARAAIAELLAAMRMLMDDNKALVSAASRGFTRRAGR